MLAEKGTTPASLVIAHRMMGLSLMSTGDLVEARRHLDQATVLYDPAEHRSLEARFNADALVASLSFRSLTYWLLGYPEAALVDNQALKQARAIGSAGTSMTALTFITFVDIECGNYSKANTETEELAALASEKEALLWKAVAVLLHGCLLAWTGVASKSVQIITSEIISLRATQRSTVKCSVVCDPQAEQDSEQRTMGPREPRRALLLVRSAGAPARLLPWFPVQHAPSHVLRLEA